MNIPIKSTHGRYYVRFNRVLHPEIVQDRRGLAESREIYRTVLSACRQVKGQLVFEPTDLGYQISKVLHRDPILARHCLHVKHFVTTNGAKTYHVGKDFAQALAKIDREIPIDVLPPNFICYISLAEGSVSDESGDVQGGYVWLGTAQKEEIYLTQEKCWLEEGKRYLSISYLNAHSPGPFPIITAVTCPLDQTSVAELVAPIQNEDVGSPYEITPEINKARTRVFRTLLNSLIYIYSQEPIIERTRPEKELGISKKELQRRSIIINECTIPVHFLNRVYASQRQYCVDSTWVDSHFRWQRCGPQFSQVRLTLVKAHERHYKTPAQC